MKIIAHKTAFFWLIAIIVAASLGVLIMFGIPVGIEFTGGTIAELSYPEGRPEKAAIEAALDERAFEGYSVRPAGENGFIIRTAPLGETKQADFRSAVSLGGAVAVEEMRFSSIGPTIGSELKRKAITAIAIVLVIIILFVAVAFRKISKPVSSWKYGMVAILTLLHDVIVPAGAYAVYAAFTGAQLDVLFVMALLAILGYSVNDTIVIFDRIRENLLRNKEDRVKESFDTTVGKSLSQSYARSVNTSLTTLFVLAALLVLGSAATQSFVFVLFVGVIAGAYSSICLAAPLITVLAGKRPEHS